MKNLLNLVYRILFLLSTLTVIANGSFVAAQTTSAWPSAPIRVIVPTTAGGAADTLMRLLATKMSGPLGTPIIIENKPGGGSVIGSDIVAKAVPDGHTILLTYTDHVFNPFLREKMPYDTLKAFTPIGLIGSVPMVLAVNKDLPVNSVDELIQYAKKHPKTLNFGSAGSGSSLHLAGELFQSLSGINIVHIPYKGTAQAYVDLIAGQIQFMFPTTASAIAHLKNGSIRGLAITSRTRAPQLPELPTIAEAGIKNYEASVWYGLLAPAGTPKNVIARLNSELHKAMEDSEVKAKLDQQGFIVAPGTPDDFRSLIHEEYGRWGKLIKDQNIKL